MTSCIVCFCSISRLENEMGLKCSRPVLNLVYHIFHYYLSSEKKQRHMFATMLFLNLLDPHHIYQGNIIVFISSLIDNGPHLHDKNSFGQQYSFFDQEDLLQQQNQQNIMPHRKLDRILRYLICVMFRLCVFYFSLLQLENKMGLTACVPCLTYFITP